MKIVHAKDRSLAAGRDVNIYVNLANSDIDYSALLDELSQITSKEKSELLLAFGVQRADEIPIDQITDILTRLLILDDIQENKHTNKYLQLAQQADVIRTDLKVFGDAMRTLHTAIAQSDFETAYKILSKVVVADYLTEPQRASFISDYFHIGYIHLANSGKSGEISSLYDLAIGQYQEYVNTYMLCLLADMEQEIATRSTDTSLLKKSLLNLRKTASYCIGDDQSSEYVEILEALCLRRIGERGDLPAITESIHLHQKLYNKDSERKIEISNNYAIALIREFQHTKNKASLDLAQKILEALPQPSERISVSEIQAYPKSLNNLGNTWKYRIDGDKHDAEHLSHAITYFDRASQYWSEISAPYEWAMLEKNKAKTRLIYAKHHPVSTAFIDKAISEAENSLRYRTQEDSSYQHRKSEEILSELKECRTSDT